MAICPACGHENIEGVDHCEQCQIDLFHLGLPETDAVGLAQRLSANSVLELKPELDLTVLPESTVGQVVRAMCDHNASGVMVVFQKKLVGVFTERDVLLKIGDRFEELSGEPIHRFMSRDPQYLDAGDSIAFGLNKMAVHSFRHVPVVRDGRPAGMIRTRDVLRYLAEHLAEAG